MKSDIIRSAIGSPELADGPLPSVLPDGLITSPSTPEAPLANHYRAQAKDSGTLTNATYGRNTIVSCESLILQRALVNRLRMKMDWNGSTEYRLTWKNSITQSFRPICRLQAQVVTISGSDSSGLPTPTAEEGKDFGYVPSLLAKLDRGGAYSKMAMLAHDPFGPGPGWPAPLVRVLDDGLPGDVELLRGYGNAICPEVAATFTIAAEEARCDIHGRVGDDGSLAPAPTPEGFDL